MRIRTTFSSGPDNGPLVESETAKYISRGGNLNQIDLNNYSLTGERNVLKMSSLLLLNQCTTNQNFCRFLKMEIDKLTLNVYRNIKSQV